MVNSHIIYFISLLHSTLHIAHDHFGTGDELASYRETNHVSPNILNHDPYDFISTTYKKYIFSFDYFLTWEVRYVFSTRVAKIGSMSAVFFLSKPVFVGLFLPLLFLQVVAYACWRPFPNYLSSYHYYYKLRGYLFYCQNFRMLSP